MIYTSVHTAIQPAEKLAFFRNNYDRRLGSLTWRPLWITVITVLLVAVASPVVWAQKARPDAVLGQWKANEKVLTIEVYRTGTEYRAKILSFTDHHSNIPSAQRIDEKNPDPALRRRKMIGMDVLYGLHYNTREHSWTGGKIYHAGSGKEYDASMELTDNGQLSVRGFKGFRLLGKSLTFHR